jgi:hypothetical protein
MLKIIVIGAAAALAISSLWLVPAAFSQIEISAPIGAPGAALKGDRLDSGARAGACEQRAWPFYDNACLYDGLRPAGEVRKVRVVYTDRLVTTE